MAEVKAFDFDEILRQAFHEYMDEKLGSSIYRDDEFQTSKSFEKKMSKMIKSEHNFYHKLTLTRARKILCVAAIIIAILLSALSVEAVRNFVANLFVTQHSNHNTFMANVDDGHYPDKLEELYELGYIPEGYKLFEKNVSEESATYIYNSEEDSLIFSQITKTAFKSNWDNKHSEQKTEVYKNQEYYIINYENGENVIIWDSGEYIFTLSANLSKKTLFSLCDTIIIASKQNEKRD